VAASAVPGALVAVAIVDEWLGHVDDPVFIGEVLFDVAKILTAVGEHQAARSAARRAVASFRAKGATRPAGLAQSWLAARGGERCTARVRGAGRTGRRRGNCPHGACRPAFDGRTSS